MIVVAEASAVRVLGAWDPLTSARTAAPAREGDTRQRDKSIRTVVGALLLRGRSDSAGPTDPAIELDEKRERRADAATHGRERPAGSLLLCMKGPLPRANRPLAAVSGEQARRPLDDEVAAENERARTRGWRARGDGPRPSPRRDRRGPHRGAPPPARATRGGPGTRGRRRSRPAGRRPRGQAVRRRSR